MNWASLPVAQWLERPTGVQEDIGSIPVGDSVDFYLFHTRDKLNISSFLFLSELKFSIFLSLLKILFGETNLNSRNNCNWHEVVLRCHCYSIIKSKYKKLKDQSHELRMRALKRETWNLLAEFFKFDPTNSKWRLQVEAAMVGNEETRAAKGRFLTLKITSRNGLNPTNVFVWKTIFQSWL